ncbi:hypothetical protein GCM10011504_02550 [Siccirubricoccus deserti]|nr:hypothetical protein GCM10011504_02550 [Siccirubricoccus deserti]
MTSGTASHPPLRDMRLTTGAITWFIGFVVALEFALSHLV